jgi:hypothetical protein
MATGVYSLTRIDGKSLRQHGTFHILFFVFALCERKNKNEHNAQRFLGVSNGSAG